MSDIKKKIVLGVVLVSAIMAVDLQSADAGPWGGAQNRGSVPQYGECNGSGYRGQTQLDEKSIEARDSFRSETVGLRKELAVKKAEKRALMLNDNPDAKRIAQLTGELFDLREQMQTKAQEKGLRNVGFDRGQGRGYGGHRPRGFQGQL